MSTIAINPVIAGNVASAADVNATFTNVATATAALSADNTQTEWVTFSHLDQATVPDIYNTDLREFCDATLTYTLTSESYTVINLGGTTPVRLEWAPTLTWTDAGEVLRVHADINVDTIGTVALPAILGANQDCFFLRLYYRDGNNLYTPLDCEWGYSVTNYTAYDVTNVDLDGVSTDFSSDLQNYAETHTRMRFRCSITGFVPAIASGVNRVELRAKLADNTVLPSVTFKEATMCAVMVRR